MTKEENIATLNEHLEHWKRLLSEKICDQDEGEKTIDALQNAIKALEQEPCGDCISRESIIEIVNHQRFGMSKLAFGIIAEKVKELPPVTPQQKMGQWEWNQYDSNPNIGNWHCSECRTIIPHMPEETDNTPIYKWCPMCGCKMREEEE